MWRLVCLALVAFAISGSPVLAGPKVLAKIDLSAQRLKLYVNGTYRSTWRVSTARRGYHTPVGRFMPFRMHKMWYSRKYHMSPMPHSLFFYRGYAVHGTYSTKYLGRPASHGCVRLLPAHARKLYQLVTRYGLANTRIEIKR